MNFDVQVAFKWPFENWLTIIVTQQQLFAGFAPKESRPHFNVFKYDSEGEKSVNRVKNIKGIGKTSYEFIVTMFPSKKKISFAIFYVCIDFVFYGPDGLYYK